MTRLTTAEVRARKHAAAQECEIVACWRHSCAVCVARHDAQQWMLDHAPALCDEVLTLTAERDAAQLERDETHARSAERLDEIGRLRAAIDEEVGRARDWQDNARSAEAARDAAVRRADALAAAVRRERETAAVRRTAQRERDALLMDCSLAEDAAVEALQRASADWNEARAALDALLAGGGL